MKQLIFHLLKAITFNYFKKRNEKNTLLILMFHQVNDKKTTFYPAMSIKAFKGLCQFIKKNYVVIHPSEINSHFSKTDKPAAIISFDDGHYDIIQNALPILSELKLPFNINVDTEILETGKPQDFVRVYNILNQSEFETYMNSKFMEKPITINRLNPITTENEFTELLSSLSPPEKREITEDIALKAGVKENSFSKMLTKEDISSLKKLNVEFGSHSHTHSLLTKIDTGQIHYELSHSKNILENILKTRIEILAYPNGVYNDEIEQIAKGLGYTIFLQTDDKTNKIEPNNNSWNSYKRINQYHQTLEEALAHTYGILNPIKKLIISIKKLKG